MPGARRVRVVALVSVLLLVIWYNHNTLLQLRDVSFRPPWQLAKAEEHGHAALVEHEPVESPAAKSPPSIPLTIPPQLNNTRADSDWPQDLLTSPSDVIVIVKTGASTIWRRMPLHLTTTLSNERAPNVVVYSDFAERLSSEIEAVDVLGNVTAVLQEYDPPAYDSYLELQSPDHINTYREHGLLPGDEPQPDSGGSSPGWFLDKYKFLPMLAHVQRNWPGLKWYIYIEDDTYIFMDNLLQWLSTLSPDDEPTYYGASSGAGDEVFAQGGSGIVFSRSLMSTVFGGEKIPDLDKYGNYTSKSCCGDTALGKVLRDQGILANKGKYGPLSFRPEPPWKTGFSDWNWCSPVFTFHHLHQRDLVQLAQLEEKRRSASRWSQRPIIFRDIFIALVLPHLSNPQRTHWDNFATKYSLKGNSTLAIPAEFHSANASTFQMAFKSPEACRAACLEVDTCLSWRHESAAAECVLHTEIKLGRELDPLPSWATKSNVVSGWMLERMNERLIADTCETVTPP